MNALKNLFSAVRAKVPTGGAAGGSGSGPNVSRAAVSFIVTMGSLGGIGYAAYHSMVTIQPGHRGLIYSRLTGLNDTIVMNEGLNFVIPWFQRVIDFDTRSRPQLIQSQSGSKDLQIVQISLRVLFRPDANDLPFIYRRLGRDFDERVLPSIVNEITKAVVAQYNASELLTKRDVVSAQIRQMLVRRALDFKIMLDDVSITHLAFSKEYTAAVEAKQVAQQDAERSKYIVDKALQEKRQIVIRAEGEAKSAELIGNAIRDNPAFVTLRRIEAAREIAVTVSSSENKVYLDSSTLLLNHLGDDNVTALKGDDKVAAVPVPTATATQAPVGKSGGWF